MDKRMTNYIAGTVTKELKDYFESEEDLRLEVEYFAGGNGIRRIIISKNEIREKADEISTEYVLTNILHELGFAPGTKGYAYLKDSIMMSYHDSSLIEEGITHKLYPEVAKKYQTTYGGVERVIRNAIEKAWTKRGNTRFQDELFGHTISAETGRPSNLTFIATIVNYLDMSLKK